MGRKRKDISDNAPITSAKTLKQYEERERAFTNGDRPTTHLTPGTVKATQKTERAWSQ